MEEKEEDAKFEGLKKFRTVEKSPGLLFVLALLFMTVVTFVATHSLRLISLCSVTVLVLLVFWVLSSSLCTMYQSLVAD